MSLRFSLLGLVALLSFAGLACAALVRPGPGWLSIVVTLTALMIAYQSLRATLASGPARASAIGWLVFAIAYLALTLGPWLGEVVGPNLLSSRALTYAQVTWRKESAEADLSDYMRRININQVRVWAPNDGTSNTLLWLTDFDLSGKGWAYQPTGTTWWDASGAQPATVNSFRLAGHWLFAWVAGWLGASVAVVLQRRAADEAA